jgi:hypothetical protein
MRERRALRLALARLLRHIALLDVAILSLAGLVCWLAGWHTWFEYGRILITGGALCAVIGAVTVVGGAGSRTQDYLYLDSMGYASPDEHTRQIVLDTYARFRLMFVLFPAGVILLLVGVVIAQVLSSPPVL